MMSKEIKYVTLFNLKFPSKFRDFVYIDITNAISIYYSSQVWGASVNTLL